MVTSAEDPGIPPAAAEAERILSESPLEIVGRLAESSNLALLVTLQDAPGAHAIYKPVRGERPLWDFPDGTLAGREVSARLVSESGGWHLVPPTVLRDGPLGPGALQWWIGDPFAVDEDQQEAPDTGQAGVVDLVPTGRIPTGWLPTFDARTEDGAGVTVVHADTPEVRSLAVLDAVMNNSDRKGSHCLRDRTGHLWAIDHGVTFSAEPKLRTVLWGWAGEPIPTQDLDRLTSLQEDLGRACGPEPTGPLTALADLLPVDDLAALRRRVDLILRTRRHPHPSRDWPAVPWPPL